MYFEEHENILRKTDPQLYKFILVSTPDAHIQRIRSRDRLDWMKENEINKEESFNDLIKL